MNSNEKSFWNNCRCEQPIRKSSPGSAMNALWKAIPARLGAGCSPASAAPCLILGDHLRQHVIGAVATQSGGLFSLIVDGVDADVFQLFQDEMAKAVTKKEVVRQLLIRNNASWHKAARVHRHHFEPKFLTNYSPDYNPIERFWL